MLKLRKHDFQEHLFGHSVSTSFSLFKEGDILDNGGDQWKNNDWNISH
jgi:hypothetical protein